MPIHDFQKTWDETVTLSEIDLATLAASKRLDELRGIKARGGKPQTDMRGAMLSVFDSTTLIERETRGALSAALESTLHGTKTLTEIDTHDSGKITVAEAIRELIIAIVFNRYVLHNIGAISDTDTTDTLAENRKRTLLAGYVDEGRRTRANTEITSLIGRLLELEDDPDLSGVDPHIVLTIARKELEVLRIMETAYEQGKSSLDSRRMIKRVEEITRPKLQQLIAEMERKVGSIEISMEPKRKKTAPPARKRTGKKRKRDLPKKLAFAGLASLAAVGVAGLMYIASKYITGKHAETDNTTDTMTLAPLEEDFSGNVKAGNCNPSEEDDDSAY